MKNQRPSISTVGFVLIVLAIVGVGLAGVMVVTTSIGAQSRELTALQREASELEYESAALQTQIETLSSTASLALRATQLGMVPNPYPAYISLEEGAILGEPTPVTGDEFPQLVGRPPVPEDVPSPEPAAEPTETEPETSQPNSEVLAAAQPGGEG